MDDNYDNKPPAASAEEGGDGTDAPPPEDAKMADSGVPQAPAPSNGEGAAEGAEGEGGSSGSGNLYLRPIFLGNLSHSCLATDVEKIFTSPAGGSGDAGEVQPPVPVDRVDMKRGYGFVFLKDAVSQAEKDRAERYVQDISGMNFPNVSPALRAEFARGDGRVKRKEDERRKKISPNETLFVVNFHEETTKREDLQMLFEPYGEIVRIEMKRNYAFVQFKTVEESIRAKDATNGGKLDQSEITVEFVARRMGEARQGGFSGGRGDGRRYRDDDRGGGSRGGYRGGRDYDDRRRDDYRPRGGGYRDRYDDHRDDRRGGGGGYDRRRRSRSRSRSPGYRKRSRSRSPGYDRGDRDYRSSRDDYRPSSRGGGRETYDDRGRDSGRETGGRDSDRNGDRGYGRS